MFLSFTPAQSDPTPLSWVDEETAGLHLGDARLVKRTRLLLGRLLDQATQSIPGACQGKAELDAAYRFLDNPKVTPKRLLTPHYAATVARARTCPVVLAPQDSSSLDYTGKAVAEQLGPLESTAHRGVWLHATLAVTPERVCLGMLEAALKIRPAPVPGRDHKQIAFEQKESVRWLRGYEAACRLQAACPDTQVISIADREGDIYEVLQAAAATDQGPRAGYLVRAAWDRARVTGPETVSGHLREVAAQLPPCGEIHYSVPKTATRAARAVTQIVRAGTVTLPPPSRAVPGETRLTPVTLQVVWLQELDPPAGEEPLDWLLVTTLPVDSPEAARQVVAYYLCRWEIELYFKVLKSGCQVEKLYLATSERLLRGLALYLIVAWRVLYLARLGQACPDVPCTVVFTEEEWQAVVLVATQAPLPAHPPTLGHLVAMIAAFGSFVGRAGDGHPGITALWVGLQRARDYARAYVTFGPGTRLAEETKPRRKRR